MSYLAIFDEKRLYRISYIILFNIYSRVESIGVRFHKVFYKSGMTYDIRHKIRGGVVEEEWAFIENWPEYMVSNQGRVYSVRFDRFLTIKGTHNRPCVILSVNGYSERHLLHLLIEEAFGIKRELHEPGSKVRIIETDEMFDNIDACSQFINGDRGAISRCIRGERETHKGYTFEYVD